jgi:hypothetical protein
LKSGCSQYEAGILAMTAPFGESSYQNIGVHQEQKKRAFIGFTGSINAQLMETDI